MINNKMEINYFCYEFIIEIQSYTENIKQIREDLISQLSTISIQIQDLSSKQIIKNSEATDDDDCPPLFNSNYILNTIILEVNNK